MRHPPDAPNESSPTGRVSLSDDVLAGRHVPLILTRVAQLTPACSFDFVLLLEAVQSIRQILPHDASVAAHQTTEGHVGIDSKAADTRSRCCSASWRLTTTGKK
jgi:hypothetical protein